VLTFTVVSGLISPLPRKPKRRERQELGVVDESRFSEALTA
jgi:hypothetical protein